MRTVFIYGPEHQPQASYARANETATGKPLPHKIVSLDGFVKKVARNGSEYEAPSTRQLDTSRFLVVVADEVYRYSRCRVHAEGWDTPLMIDKTANMVLIELGFDPTHILNDKPAGSDLFVAY